MNRKILHIITGLGDGGAEGVLVRLCLYSNTTKHVVISLMDEGKYGAVLRAQDIKVICLGMKPGKISLTNFLHLVNLIRVEQPDLVQTWMYHADLLGGIAARIAGVHRVFWGIRHSTLEKGESKRTTLIIARLCAILSRWVPEKILCCANSALSVHADIGYEKSKLLVIKNGYDLSRFKPDPVTGRKVRNDLDISVSKFLIGNVGRFAPPKDHSNLLRALVLFSQQKVDYQCLLVGKGLTQENAILTDMIVALGLEDRILLIGQNNEIPPIMNALDLHVLSSCSEGFPNVLAEAMATGTPCVSTDVGDAIEIIDDTGFCCSAKDPVALAAAIMRAYVEWKHHSDQWQVRKAKCVLRVRENFSLVKMVNAYESCWFP